MMTDDQVTALDAAWFKKHPRLTQAVRHAYAVERQQAFAADSGFGIPLVLVLITRVRPGRMHRQMICVIDDKIAGFIVRNGLGCIGIQEGQLCIPISGTVMVLQ